MQEQINKLLQSQLEQLKLKADKPPTPAQWKKLLAGLTNELEKQSSQINILTEALGTADIGTWEWNLQTNEILWSDNLSDIFALTVPFDGTFEGYQRLIHPDDLDAVTKALQKTLEEHVPYVAQHRIVAPDNEIIWIEGNATLQVNAEGNPTYLTGTVANITERMRTQELLTKRSRQDSAVAAATQILNTNDEDALEKMLEYIQLILKVDRISIFQNIVDSKGHLCLEQTHEVTSFTAEPLIDLSKRQNLRYTKFGFKAWKDALSQDQTINELVADMPSKQRKFFEPHQILAVMAIPIRVDSEWYGFLMLDNAQEAVIWDLEMAQTVRTLADIVGTYISRQHMFDDLETRVEARTAALRASEEQARSLIASAPDPLIIFDKDEHVTYVNPPFTETFGWELQEIQGLKLDFIPVGAPDHPLETDKVAVEKGSYSGFETQRLTKGGRILEVENSISIIRGTDNEPDGYVVTLRDVTVRRRIERELRVSEARLSRTTENAPGMIFQLEMGSDGRFSFPYVSSWIERTFQLSKDVLHTDIRPFISRIHPDDMDSLRQEIARSADQLNSFEWEGRIKQPNGVWTFGSAKATPIAQEDGTVLWSGVLLDVTELREVEEELRRVQDQRLDHLVEQSPLAVIEWDQDFCVRRWNKTAQEIFGYTAEEAIGQHAKLILDEAVWPIVDQIWHHLTNLSGGERSTNQNLRKDRQAITCDWFNSPLIDNMGNVTGVMSIVADITSRIEVQNQIAYQANLLEEISEAIISADQHFKIITWNKAAAKMYGYEAEEVMGKFVGDYIETIYTNFSNGEARKLLMETGNLSDRAIQKVKNGRELTITTSASVIVNDQGEMTGFVAVNRDISELEAAQTERDRLNMVLENTLDFVTISDVRGNVEFINPAGLNMLGLKKTKRVREITLADAIPGWVVPILYEEAIPKTVKTGRWSGEIAIQHKNGTETPVSLAMMAHHDSNNEVAYISSIGRDITARKALERQTQESLARRSRQVELTTQIAQDIASTSELYDLYQRVVDLVKESFGYYYTQLLQYNPALDAMALVVGYGEIGQKLRDVGHFVPMGTGLIGQAAATGNAVLQPDVTNSPSWISNPNLPDTKAELAVPIRFNNQVIAILDIQNDKVGSLTQEDRVVMEGLCGQIAIAIESTRLRQDMTERLQELNDLQRLMSREGWSSYQSTISHNRGYLFDQATLQKIGQGSGQSNGGELNDFLTTSTNGRLVTNTISIRGEHIGTLGIQDSSERPLSREENELLKSISVQVAEALENARLLEQTQKRAVELETVAQVSTATSTILEREQLLTSVADLTKESFGLYHAHIYLLDEELNELVLEAGAGEIGQLLVAENWRIPLYSQKSLVAQAARARKGLISRDVHKDASYLPNPLLPETQSELAVPMIAGDRLLGVIDLQANVTNGFTQEDLQIHTTLATQVAIAVTNANLYQEQIEAAEQLREVDRLKSEFLASMSHELRTPLNSIIGFADVLLEGIDGELNDRMEEDVLLIRDGGQHLRNLIGDILDMSKIEAGMMDLSYNLVELERVAFETAATLKGLIGDKPVQTLLDIHEDVGIIEADRTRLMQIMLNLTSNAAKFTDEGTITISMQKQQDMLLVGVHDTGVGIKDEDISQVFEQFRQIGGIEHRKAGGTGLGMPITKQLVELHGGEIWLESTFGVGSVFWFTIPYDRPIDRPKDKALGYYA